jgi:hypothetical protein
LKARKKRKITAQKGTGVLKKKIKNPTMLKLAPIPIQMTMAML